MYKFKCKKRGNHFGLLLQKRGSFYILKEEKIGKMIVDLDMSEL